MNGGYPTFDLILGVDFRELDRREAKAFFAAFMAAMPERLKALESAVGEIAEGVKLDFSDGSLLAVSELCVRAATARVRSDEEIAAAKATLQPHWQFLEPDRIVPNAASICLGIDSCIYLAECLRSRFPALTWKLSPEGPRCMDYNRPVLWGFPWKVALDPIGMGFITAIKALNGEEVALDKLLGEWCKTARGMA
jgi:hypothetical protein